MVVLDSGIASITVIFDFMSEIFRQDDDLNTTASVIVVLSEL